MNRLDAERQRLYGIDGTTPAGAIDAAGRVRALVLGLARPADWQALAAVWHGVQADLALPAPAIAVSGPEGYQLWLSLGEAVPAAQAMTFLEGLRRRYLAEVEASRVSLWPRADGDGAWQPARPVPAPLAPEGPWSAFVAPDLAPMFSEEPWLDMPPNPEGQADLLARLATIPRADFEHALSLLGPAPAAAPVATPDLAPAADASPAPRRATTDPRQFLLDVMTDDRVPLALRIEAAKALLPHTPPAGSRER